jgi:uncharacterized protein (DUF433 family)
VTPVADHDVTALAPDDPRTTWALYTINEAARYLGTPYTTLRRWVRPEEHEPLVSTLPKEGHHPVLPFVGFAEAFVLAAAYRGGMRPERIVEGVDAVKAKYGRKYGIEHVLASRLLYTDRAELLLAEAQGDERELTVARTNQLQLTATVKEQLQLITYGDDGYATRIVLPADIYGRARVVVDPEEAFGHPILERTGTRVRDVVGLFWAGEDIEDIAYDFSLKPEEVQDVIRAQTKPASQ